MAPIFVVAEPTMPGVLFGLNCPRSAPPADAFANISCAKALATPLVLKQSGDGGGYIELWDGVVAVQVMGGIKETHQPVHDDIEAWP